MAYNYLGYRGNDEGFHSRSGIVRVLLVETGIDDVYDVVNGQRGLGNVGGQNNFACAGRCRLKYLS